MARIISQAVDELGNLYLLKDDGILEKRTSVNVLVWSQQTKQEPTLGTFVFANAISLDIDNNVWLAYSDALNIAVRATATGLVLAEVPATASNVIASQAVGDKMFALSTSRGLLYEINRTTKVLIRSFDLTIKVPGYTKSIFASQITSSNTGRIYFPAFVGAVGEQKTSALVKLDPTGSG